jgi:hypothetical protein
MTVKVINLFDEPIDSASLQQAMTRLQRKSNVASIQSENDPYLKSRIRKPMMRCHSFRKIFNTICIQNNMNHSVKEKLMGHKKELELDFNYYRPSEEQLLKEYLNKVVDDLTVNEENRLKRENQELKKQDDYNKFLIDKEMKEMRENNQMLTSKINEYEEAYKEGRIMSREHKKRMDESHKRLSQLEERFEKIFSKFDNEQEEQQQ